jgi:ADP-ribose pyrophosphatase YjhB (NUDIX family)
MHRIFIADKVIELRSSTPLEEEGNVLNYDSDKAFDNAVEILMKKHNHKVIITGKEKTELLDKMLSHFKTIVAAGGLVENIEGKFLFIYRYGLWDLPKGKVEIGEDINIAAIREVEEECGIEGLEITKELIQTYHMYQIKGEWIIKKTYWFYMKTNSTQRPVPQKEEGITQAKWLSKTEVMDAMKNTYSSVKELIESVGKIN